MEWEDNPKHSGIQKELRYNDFLPYSTKLDKEAAIQLSDIKGLLGRSIQSRDIKWSTFHWTEQLSKCETVIEIRASIDVFYFTFFT